MVDGGWGVGTDVGASELPQVRTKRAGRRFGVGRGLQRTAPSRMKDNPLFAILPRPCLAFWRKTLPVSTSCCLQSAKSFVYSALSVINRRKSSQPGGGGYDGARATARNDARLHEAMESKCAANTLLGVLSVINGMAIWKDFGMWGHSLLASRP